MAMGSIYAHAFFTIVSADGDVGTGIPGLGGQASQSIRRSNVLQATTGAEMLYGIRQKALPTNTTWASRGWTFQEQMFSKRLIVFYKGRFILKCRKAFCQEDFNNELPIDRTDQQARIDDLTNPGWPDLQMYRQLVENYSKRTLSFPCDSISAFAGIVTTLRGSFPGGFLFGLPETYFDIALLWQPGVPVQDRCRLARLAGRPVEPLPSWSWCRWQGALNIRI
jgi:hypothetical protein